MLFKKKSGLQRVLDTIEESLDAANEARPTLRRLGSVNVGKGKGKGPGQQLLDTVSHTLERKPALPGLGSTKVRKAGLIAAGSVAGLTAGSAGISSLRRRSERPRDDS